MTENQTTVQLLKILAKQNPKNKKSRKKFIRTAYPKGIENRYKSRLSLIFKPLIDYVKKFLNENAGAILNGDSRDMRLDAIPGKTYREMSVNMQEWVNAMFPDDPETATYIYPGLRGIAEDLKEFSDREFSREMSKAINVSIREQAEWWDDMVDWWSGNNYQLIKSNASNFVNKINVLVEQAVTSGSTVSELQKEILKVTEGLSDAKCRLLARDQIGKLQGQISQGQMAEIGLEMYVWSTSGDERVRDSHLEMEGLLCRWDDATVYSADGGKTWIDRPAGAVEMHPGQDIQCRCVALAYFPELESLTV